MNKTIDLSIALLERYMGNNNIEITDIDTFQYEVYPKLGSSHSDFGGNPEYKEFYNDWDGENEWNTRSSQQAKAFISKTLDKLNSFKESLKDNPQLSSKLMKDGQIDYNDPEFKEGIPRELHVGYVNSVYSHRNINMAVLEWLEITIESESETLNDTNEALKLSHEEAYEKYGFNQEDVSDILDSFNEHKDSSLHDALAQVSSSLSPFQRRAYISVLTSIANSRISGLPDKYWYTTIEEMQKRM